MTPEDLCLREPTGFSGYPVLESYASPYYLYKHVVATSAQFLRRMEWLWAANVVGALLWEPREAIEAGNALSIGKETEFHHFGMNPTSLKEWQRDRIPILALHGKNGNQGMFLKMGEYFERHRIGPLFTVNLCAGELTEKNREIIDQKIAEIQSLYGYGVKVDLLGYSLGAEEALYSALPSGSYKIHEGYCYQTQTWSEWRPEVNGVIRIGSMTLKSEWDHLSDSMKEVLWEIRGLDDIHMPEPSFARNRVEIDGVGHVGLVSSPSVFSVLKTLMS